MNWKVINLIEREWGKRNAKELSVEILFIVSVVIVAAVGGTRLRSRLTAGESRSEKCC